MLLNPGCGLLLGPQPQYLANVEGGGHHAGLEVDFGQAGAFGPATAVNIGQVVDDTLNPGALFHFEFELLGLVVLQGSQDVRTEVTDEDPAAGVGLAVGFAAVGQIGGGLQLFRGDPEGTASAHLGRKIKGDTRGLRFALPVGIEYSPTHPLEVGR